MNRIIIFVSKILLITFVGNILMKSIIPSLEIPSPFISALLTPVFLGVLVYFLFKKNKPKANAQ